MIGRVRQRSLPALPERQAAPALSPGDCPSRAVTTVTELCIRERRLLTFKLGKRLPRYQICKV